MRPAYLLELLGACGVVHPGQSHNNSERMMEVESRERSSERESEEV